MRTAGPSQAIYQANVVLVDRLIDAASGTFRVRLALDNPELKIAAGLDCYVSFDMQVDDIIENAES